MSVEVKVPQLGESIVEATVGRWLKHVGETVSAGDALVELETDKVNMEVAATDGGTLQSIARQEGETVGIGDVLAIIDEAESRVTASGVRPPREQRITNDEPPTANKQQRTTSNEQPIADDEQPIADDDQRTTNNDRSTPLARRIAAENELDIGLIRGTGPSGRVTKEDVLSFLRRVPETPSASAPAAPPPTRSERVFGERREERIRMSRRRQTIARRLVEAQHTAAMLTTFNEADMMAIVNIRKRRRDSFKERYGIGLGFMSFFTKAVIGALKDYPRLNAEIQGDEILLKHYYDIGIAVGTEDGLVVPVIRDADRLSFAEIEREIADLATRTREGRLSLPELQGGTFTITNGGIYGSLMSTPILNTPQVGILGMHKIQDRPVAVEGGVVVRPMMYLALSYDHRIVDGSEAVRFLVRVKELVEDPDLLLVEG
jgi:2-oxoglutarate dehydrogenase E2 component (dihydrolipoamide succinyltransferase)